MNHRFASILRLGLLIVLLARLALPPQSPVYALTTLTVQPLTWNVIGLDSNDVSVGPNHFPIGARICNTGSEAATNITATFKWDNSDTTYINLRPGTNSALSLGTLNPGSCATNFLDAYFEVEVTRNSSAYNNTRPYHIEVTAGNVTGTISTPTPRELFIEHLISQNRNWVRDIKLNGTSIPTGGTMTLMVGQTYNITINGSTATQGYNQLEEFINFPNTIFRVLAVSTTYSADNVPGYTNPSNKLYGDACTWENVPSSPNYRSCIGGDYKNGGDVDITYTVKILSVPNNAPYLINPEPLSTLIYDFSGSSYHYNADYGVSTRYAYIVNAGITKSFQPKVITAGGTSTMTFTIQNPGPDAISNAKFDDTFPAGLALTTTTTPTVSYSGCGSPTPAAGNLTAGATSLSFSGITVAGNSTCTITISSVAAAADGNYTNTTGHLFINNTDDTGNFGSDTLVVSSKPPAPSSCAAGSRVVLATWSFPTTGQGSGGTNAAPEYTTKPPSDVSAVLTTASSAGSTFTRNNTQADATHAANAWDGTGWPKTTTVQNPPTYYFQFNVDSSNYGGIAIAYDYFTTGNEWGGTNSLVEYSANDGSWTNGASSALAKNAWTSRTVAATTSGTSTTSFRISALGEKSNDTSNLWIDNISITGCPRTVTDPTLSKSFLTSPIQQGNNSVLRFMLTNPNTSSLTGVNFTDTLPTGLLIATPNGLTTSCTVGTLTGGATTATAGTTLISLSGATLSANANCTISINVLGNVAGSYTNTSSPIRSTETGPNITSTGYGTSPLNVIAPPTILKSVYQSSILLNGTATMSFTITNPNSLTALTGIAFTDNGAGWPAGVTATNGTTNNVCGVGSSLVVSGGNSIALTGGSLAAGASCTFSVTVTGTTAGTKTNTTSTVTATGGGLSLTGSADSATLTVNNPVSLIGLNKQVSTDNINWFKYVGLTPSPTQNVWYKFTITNDGETTLNNISVTDSRYSMTGCTPALPTTLAAGVSASCVLGPFAVTAVPTPNPFDNVATVTTTTYTPATPVTSTAKYGTESLSIIKNATESYFTAAGTILHYSYTVSNNGGYPLAGPVTVTDDKIGAVACQDPTAVGDLDAYLDPGESIACPATGTVTYTVLAADVTAKVVTNTAHGSANGINSPDAVKTIPLAALTIDKDTTTPNIDVNGNIVYSIVVANTGQAALTNFQVSDILPAFGGTSAVLSVTAPGYTVNGSYTGTAPNTNLLAGTDTLAVGATATITVTVDLVNATAGTYDNTATVTTTQTGSIDDDGLTAGDPGTPSLAADPETDEDVVVYVQPDLTVTKTNSTANGWTTTGGTFQWTITARNGLTAGTASFANGDEILSDSLPTGQTYGAVTVTNGTPAPTGAVNCSITGTTLSCVANGPVTLPTNASFNVAFNVTTAGTANLPNTATIDPGNKVPESNEGNNTGSNTVSIFDATPSKLLVTTSEPSTSTNRVTIGEMVRYRIAARIPQGSFTNFQLVDNIPSGLQFLNDGTARFAFVSNGGAITSSTLTCANDTGNAFDLVSLPTSNVDCSFTGGISGGAGNGAAVTFSMGNLTNSDSDLDAEYVVIELNALVLNVNTSTDINQGTNNVDGTNNTNFRLNDTTLRVNNTTVGANSGNVSVNIAEPGIVNVVKSVSAGPYISGNTVTYTLTFSNVPSSNTNATTAFDIVLTDALNANLTPGTVNVSSTQTSPCAGGTPFTTSNSTAGQNVTVNLSCLDPDRTVTVTINATINASTAGGTSISNTGNVTYTSLPGLQGSCVTAPFTCSSVGGSGTGTGERNGTEGAGTDATVLNNYADSGTISFTIQPTITANDDNTASTLANTPVTTVVTTNDTNSGGSIDPASVTVTAQPPAGTGSVACTGASCQYTPPAGYVGTTTYTYQVCLAAPNGAICDTATVTVTVTPTINAVDDDFSASPFNGGVGGTTASVIGNDTTNGVAASLLTNVTLTPGTSPNAGLTMNSDGTITVAAGTAAGTYIYPYTICTNPATTPATCDTANATVVVTAPIITANDDSTTTSANTPVTTVVTANDTNVGGSIDPASVTVTAQPPAGEGSVTCTGASCQYTPPAGFVGTTTYTYQVCLAAPYAAICDPAVVTVTVTPTINAVDDDYSSSPVDSGSGGTTASVIGNDTTNGVAANVLTNVTLTPGTAPTPVAGSITMNADGTITVAAGTTAGTYTYPYTICTNPATTPATCDTANATVVVTAVAPVADVTTTVTVPATANAGSTVNGTVTFANNGPFTAANTAYTFTMSSGLGTVSFPTLPVGVIASYDNATGTVTLTGMPTSLTNGQTLTIDLSYTAPSTGPVAVNTTISTTTSQGVNAAPDSASGSTMITPIADVTTTVTVPATANAGSTVNGTVTFANNGPSTAVGVGYTVTMTPGLGTVSFPTLPVGVIASYDNVTGTVTLTGMPASLASGQTVAIDLSYTAPASGPVTVSTSISTTTSQGVNTAPDSAAGNTTITPIADVTTTVTVPATANAGSIVNGTVTFANNGPSTATGVGYTFTVTPGLGTVSFPTLPVGVTASYDNVTGAVTLSGMPASLNSGQTLSIDLSYTAPASGPVAVDTAISTTTSQGSNTAPDTATGSTTITPIADVTTTVTVPAGANAGSTVNGTVTFTNNGPSTAVGVGYTFTMNPGLGTVSFPTLPVGVTASYDNATGTVTLTGMPASLTSGQNLSIGLSYTAPATGPVIVDTTISTTTSQGANTAPDTASGSTVITPIADVTTTVTVPASATAGSTGIGTVTFSNNGPSTAANTVYTFTITPGLGTVSFPTLPVGVTANYDNATGTVTLTGMPTSLTSGQILSIGLSYTAPSTGPITVDTAITTTTSQGANAAPDTATGSTTITPIADVTTTVTVPATANAGSTVNGTVTFSNNGPSTAAGVGYTFTITPGLGTVSFPTLPVGVSASYDNATGTVTLTGMPASLNSGQTLNIGLSYTAPATGPVTVNTTISTTTSQGANVAPDNASGSTTITPIADVTTTVTVLATANAGSTVNGTVTFANNGPSTVAGVGYTFTMSSGLGAVSFPTLPAGVTASYDNATGTVTLTGMPTSLTSGQTLMIDLSYTAPATGPVTVNTTISTATSQGANTAPDTASGSTAITSIVDVTTTVTVPASATAGGTVNGTVTFANNGPSPAANTTYTFIMTAGLSAVSFPTLPAGVTASYDNATGAVTLTGMPTSLTSGQTLSIGLSYTAPATGPVTVNTAITTTTSQGANTAPDSASGSTTVNTAAIGVAKRVVSNTEVSPGLYEITYELNVRNYSAVALNNVQVTDDLRATFPAPIVFTVQSVTTSAGFTANGTYSGTAPNTNLLNGGDSLAAGTSGTITIVVRVTPTSAGPFSNIAVASGQCPTCATPVTDQSQTGTNPDPDGDNDPTNNNVPTVVNFGPNLFDPPIGIKTFDASGLPLLQWTMVWINNSNIVAINTRVNDPIVSGTTFAGGLTCIVSGSTTTTVCTYDAATNSVIWQGNLGPDLGATDAASAANEVTITFNVNVATGVRSVQNVATVDTDLNGNSLLTDPGEQQVASANSRWSAGTTTTNIPATGFAPNVVTEVRPQPKDLMYANTDLILEIPSLGIKLPIVGVPKKNGAWDVSWLVNQAGWLEGTAFPSWDGNSVLTSHVYASNGLPGPFVNLGKLKYGDKIIIHAYGQKYTFEVRTNDVVGPKDASVFKHEEKSWLTLVTCKEYDQKTNTYKKRTVVRAVLVKVEAE